MADVQLTSLQVGDGHNDYVVPPSALVRLKSVRAEFRDNGASGNWLPVVTLISDSAHAIADAIDHSAQVTAGGDANASFFPGGRSGVVASSGGGGSAYAQGLYEGSPPFFFTGPDEQPSPFTIVDTTDPSVMSWSTTTNTNDTLTLHAAGTYTFFAGIQRSGGGTDSGCMIYSTQDFGAAHQYFGMAANAPLSPLPFAPTDEDFAVLNTTGGTVVQLLIENPTSFQIALFDSSFAAVYNATGSI